MKKVLFWNFLAITAFALTGKFDASSLGFLYATGFVFAIAAT